MNLVGFEAKNHPQQVSRNGANPKVDDRKTPPEIFDPLHERYQFTIDVAASKLNAMLPRYYTIEIDGLAQSWAGERVWANPPYSSIEPWVAKANSEQAELIVMLAPANRTEQRWWQRHIEPYRDGRHPDGPRTEFISGRTRFIAHDRDGIRPNERPPFGCCLLIWGG